jgi:AcrR family transcriptional regulator
MPENLATRLIEVGVDLVAREGPQALSLREIARRDGVSHGAPRRYFPTHQALLAAIAREGYRWLGQRITSVVSDGEADPRDQLLALGRIYLEFARGNRGMFELMFRYELVKGGRVGLREESLPLFGVLVELVRRARPEAAQPSAIAGALWANLHGIAQLWQWGTLQLAVETEDVEPLLQAVFDAHLGPAGGR